MNKRLTISTNNFVDLSFILFFSSSLVRVVFDKLLGSGNLSEIATALAIYAPLFIACIINPKKYIKLDFIILYIMILTFFGVTLLLHPEYRYYYTRDEYGVWPYVLRPYRGLYAYLFLRLMDRPERFIRNYRISGWLMFVYFVRQFMISMQRGYWYGVGGNNGRLKMSYSVSFGYAVLPFALFFLYQALKHRKMPDIIAAAVALVLILSGGSRGPILFIGLFVVLYFFIGIKNSKRKFGIIFATIILFLLLYFFYDLIISYISELISRMGFSSRFITSLLNGNIMNDSGRGEIWEAAIQMIKDNPFGYGAMGSQHVIIEYIYAGYPHSLILELLIDFGVIVGTIIILILFYNAFLMIFSVQRVKWIPVFLPLFCTSCGLFISLTYWGLPAFWACIGIGVNCIKEKKGRNLLCN